MVKNEVVIEIRAEVAKLKKGMKEAEKEINKLKKATKGTASQTKKLVGENKKLGSTLGQLKTSYLAVAASAAILVKGIQSSVQAYRAQEQAEARLSQALINQNAFTDATFDSLKNLASQLQQTTIFSDEQTLSGAAMLASFKLNAKQIQDMIPLMQDLATMTAKTSGSQSDLESIGKLVGLALEGQAGRLKQAGISLTDLQTAAIQMADRAQKANIVMEVMRQNAEGLARATGETASAGIQKLSNTIGDLGEVIGEVIIKESQESVSALNTLIRFTINLSKTFDELIGRTQKVAEEEKKFREEIKGLTKEERELAIKTRELEQRQDKLVESLIKMKFGKAAVQALTFVMEDYNQMVIETKTALSNASLEIEQQKQAMEDLDDGVENASEAYTKFSEAIQASELNVKKLRVELREVDNQIKGLTDVTFKGETANKEAIASEKLLIAQRQRENLDLDENSAKFKENKEAIEKSRIELDRLRLDAEIAYESVRTDMDNTISGSKELADNTEANSENMIAALDPYLKKQRELRTELEEQVTNIEKSSVARDQLTSDFNNIGIAALNAKDNIEKLNEKIKEFGNVAQMGKGEISFGGDLISRQMDNNLLAQGVEP